MFTTCNMVGHRVKSLRAMKATNVHWTCLVGLEKAVGVSAALQDLARKSRVNQVRLSMEGRWCFFPES